MPSYMPFHWQPSTPMWRTSSTRSSTPSTKDSLDYSAGMLWAQDSKHSPSSTSPWTALEFPWDKTSILDDRSIPWQVSQSSTPSPSCWGMAGGPLGGGSIASNGCVCPSHESSNYTVINNTLHSSPSLPSPSPALGGLMLDPNTLMSSPGNRYQPLRESPTPPKAKKKCTAKRSTELEGGGVREEVSLRHREPHPANSNNNNNRVNSKATSNNIPNSISNSYNNNNSDEPLSTTTITTELLYNNNNNSQSKYQSSSTNISGISSVTKQPTSCSSSLSSSASNSTLLTTVSANTQPPSSARVGAVDPVAFQRYYEGGSPLGEHVRPRRGGTTHRGTPAPSSEDQGVCGGLGPLSLALALPGKLEGLLKLLAQSLHLVLAGFCSRKARRKERESPATEQEHKLYLEEAVLERKIPETDLRQLVELPPGLGYHEWLASHTIDFFQHINLVYGTIAEYCTMSGCSDMSGPATRPYLWFDEKGKKVRVAAPQYIDYVMTFTQKTINDETIFPTKFDNDFPVSFESIVKKIHRLLFHVIAHLYHSHFRELVLLSLHAHLNCIFAHFTLFNERFRLIEEKETEILHDLVLALRLHPSEDKTGEGGDGGSSSKAQETLRHLTEAATGVSGGGRTSPAAASTPPEEGTPGAHEPLQGAQRESLVPDSSVLNSCIEQQSTPFLSPSSDDSKLTPDTRP